MTVRPRVVRRTHLYEVGLGEGDAVGGAHRAADQLGGGGGGGSDGRREGREQRVDDDAQAASSEKQGPVERSDSAISLAGSAEFKTECAGGVS